MSKKINDQRWEKNFDIYLKFFDEFGRFPKQSEEYDGNKIGIWCETQRKAFRENKLLPERYNKLKDAEFFNYENRKEKNDATWEKKYKLLIKYLQEYNRYPKNRETYQDEKIGIWCFCQKRALLEGSMCEERYRKLDNIGFWDNYGRAACWNNKYQLLCEYIHDICEIPNYSTVYKGVELGKWCQVQCKKQKRGKLSEERFEKLKELGFWNKKTSDDIWNEKYDLLSEFIDKHNRFPYTDEVYKEFNIGPWVSTQRISKKEGNLSNERYQKLEKLGIWNTISRSEKEKNEWERKYKVLSLFISENKRLPLFYEEKDGIKIGIWAVNQKQRYKQGKMSKERYDALNKIDFWNMSDEKSDKERKWNDKYELLLEFIEIYGRLPKHMEIYKDIKIGYWCSKQRKKKKAGKNFRHTWSSDPSPDLWLDGLYMILPFRAEYAKHMNNTAELDLIVDRLQWVSDNMYNESKGLFYHAADNANSNSGTYWLRAIGWYAAALVDVMDSMEGENLEAMKVQLKKLVDGMKACQNSTNGMWTNNMAAGQSSSNPYETSGTALTCYAVMKAVNNGWLDESYADMATLAFKGICNEKMSSDYKTLKDICFKGVPNGANSTYYDNEGKGVGPFIMFYAEVQEYVNNLKAEKPVEPGTPVEPETPVVPEEPGDSDDSDDSDDADNTVKVDDTVIAVEGVTGLTGGTVTEADKALIEKKPYDDFVAYDIEGTITGTKATVSIPVPEKWNATEDELVGISVEDGRVKQIKGTLKDGVYTFKVSHFSAKGVAYDAKALALDTGNLVGSKVYTLKTKDDIDITKKYLIVDRSNNGTGYALTNNNGTAKSTNVTISDGTITVEDDANIAWGFSGKSSGTIENNGRYVHPNNGSLSLNTSGTSMNISNQGSGAYRIYRSETTGNWWNEQTYYYYLRYNNNSWTGSTSNSNVYLYEYTSTNKGDTVTFSVSPDSCNIKPEETIDLEGTVTVAGETVDLNDCTITWKSTNEEYATVSNGTVTGVADGKPSIKATLSAVNGVQLAEAIELTIPVTVATKTIKSAVVTGNSHIITENGKEPEFDNIKLNLVYDDTTTETIEAKNLEFSGYDVSVPGRTIAFISYNDTVYGSVAIIVEGDPYVGLDPARSYPEYPADGAVRIDKTANSNANTFRNTGVTRVELDVAGVSVKKGINVIMISDISNSMSWNDTTYNYNDTTVGEKTSQRLNISKESAMAFANEFLGDNTGADTDNTFTLLAFAGIDGHYNTHSTAKDNDDVYQVGELGMTSVNDAESAIGKLVKATTGGTNYDYAFQQAYDLSQKLYEKNGKEVYIVFMTDGVPTHYNGVYYKSRSNTDLTAHMQYVDPVTGDISYYTSNGNDRNGKDIDYTAKQDITVHYNDGTKDTKNVTYNKGWSDYVINNQNGWAEKVKALDYVSAVYSIGFGMKNGSVTQGATSSMPTLNNVNGGDYYIPSSTTQTLLKHIASTEADYHEADNAAELKELYASLATQLRYAGTSAQVTDIIDKDFTLQMSNTSGSKSNTANLSDYGITPKITVTTYDLYTKADTTDKALIGKRTGNFNELETVTFNASGTEAYSNKINNGTTNIMNKENNTVTISAQYFTYIKDAQGIETFEWNIGNITDKEIVLGFDVYLKDSLEGDREQGIYYTNENATLKYIDINGDYATKPFPRPAVNWGGASTTIRFYLVNENGEPVNRAGNVVPMANCIYVGDPVTKKLNLNQDSTIDAQVIEAAAHVPDEYYLYDINASYTIQTLSGDNNSITGGITPSEPSEDAYKTVNGKTQTGAQTTIEIESEPMYYTYSTVGFGVRWDLTKELTEDPLVEDTVVIDYGLPVNINVLANDPKVEGYDRELTGFIRYNSNIDTNEKKINAGSPSLDLYDENNFVRAKYKLVDGKVQFSLNKMISEKETVFYVVKYSKSNNTEDFYYLFGKLTVIPATTIYYEDSFVDFEVYEKNVVNEKEVWNKNESKFWSQISEENVNNNVTQAEDRPGTKNSAINTLYDADNVYGYDEAYSNCSKYSLGSAKSIDVDENTRGEASFEFYGTGFDIVGLTSNTTGTLIVQVTDENKQVVKSSIVDTYYGYALDGYIEITYKYDATNKVWEEETAIVEEKGENEKEPEKPTDGQTYTVYKENWKVVDSNNPNALYQIPVMKISGLDYGKYKAKLIAGYNKFFDHKADSKNENGKDEYDSYELYIDAVRIYDPANDGIVRDAEDKVVDTTVNDAYLADKEAYPVYTELRDELITKKTFDSLENREVVTGLVFVDGAYKEGASNTPSVADYESKGPNNEVYLHKGQAIAFDLNATAATGTSLEQIHLGIKSVGGEGIVEVYGIDKENSEEVTCIEDKQINTATDMYYDITKLNGKTVVIRSSGDAIISITNIKTTYTAKQLQNTEASKLTSVSLASVNPVLKSLCENPEVKAVNTNKSTYTVKDSIKSTVKTNNIAKYVVVNGEKITDFDVDGNSKVWTYTEKANNVGKMTLNVIAYNGLNETSNEVSKKVTVKQFTPKTFKLALGKSKVVVGDTVKATVTTSSDVSYVKVNGTKFTKYTTNKSKSTRIWTLNVKASNEGKMTVKAVAYNKNGSESKAVSKNVTVNKFAPKTLKLALGKSKVVVGDTVKATVTTSSDVSYVKVNGTKVTKYTTNKSKSTRTWSLNVKASSEGKRAVKAVAYNKNGSESKAVSKNVTVNKFAPKAFKVTSNSTVKKGNKYTVSVSTSSDVSYVKVNDKKITKFTSNKAKTVRTFKVTYTAKTVGKATAKVVAYNKNGYASKAKTKTVTVKKK